MNPLKKEIISHFDKKFPNSYNMPRYIGLVISDNGTTVFSRVLNHKRSVNYVAPWTFRGIFLIIQISLLNQLRSIQGPAETG